MAIIESVFNCQNGDDAARTLRSIVMLETDDTMRRRLVDAFARTESPLAVGFVADMTVMRSSAAAAPYAVETLTRIGALDLSAAENALQRLVKAVATDPALAAAAQDALDILASLPHPAG